MSIRRQSGTTLIELVIAIVIIAIAASAVLGALTSNIAHSADPMINHQAVAIASTARPAVICTTTSMTMTDSSTTVHAISSMQP
jgi:prepilin-type N-terminal cleavage/methylation domain-containing protein